MIYEILKEGRENALSPDYIQIATGIRSKREVRRKVEEERRNGFVILSDMGSGGYYRPADAEEVRKFIKTFEGRAKSTLYTLKGARRYLKAIEKEEEAKAQSGQQDKKENAV